MSSQIFLRTRSANISAPPPGSESSPAVLQLAQDLLVGPAVQIREERDLDGGEALQMDLGTDPLEAAQQLRVVLERQIGMQAVDDVDFGQRLAGALAQLVPRLFERHRVRAGVAGPQPRERAEQAAGDADVGRFEPDVEVVVRARAVAALALAIGQPSQRQRIGTLEQPHAVLERQPLAGVEFRGDVREPRLRDPSLHDLDLTTVYTSRLWSGARTAGHACPTATRSGCKAHAVPPL